MTGSNSDVIRIDTATAPGAVIERPGKKAPGGERNRRVRTQAVNAPRAGKAGKSPKGAKSAKRNAATSGKKASENSAREGSKTDAVLKLLRGSGGATLNDLMKATGWQAHSVRGFISGTVGRKMGLTVVSRKIDSGERAYSIHD